MGNIGAIEMLRESLHPLSMGGELMDMVVGEARVEQLAKSREVSLKLGELIPVTSTEAIEKRAKSYRDHVMGEAQNLDWKVLPGTQLPTETDLRALFHPEEVKVVIGNTTSNPHATQMLTVEFDRGDGTARKLRVSYPFKKGDRRWSEDTTVFGRFALNHLCQVIDVHTQQVMEISSLPRERFDVENVTNRDPNFLLIQSSRYVWNLIKGNGVVNPNQIVEDSWMPDVTDLERDAFLNFAMEVPYLVMDGKIDPSTLDEYRNRMMGCFCINPKLFLNLSNCFHFSATFPYFEKHEQLHRYYEDVDNIPATPEEFDGFLREIMGDDYSIELSPLGNVARMFGIGRGWDGGMLQ